MKKFCFLPAFLLVCLPLFAQPTRAADCNAALAKDYYSYASKNHLAEDYVRSLDRETYDQMKTDNSFSLSALTQYGPFKVGDDFSSFTENRTKYLENTHYTRNQDEAVQILQLTTSDRAYKAYESCLRMVGTGGGVLVWAESETLNSIDLHIKYANPSGVSSITLKSTLDGGLVKGAPTGMLWAKKDARWGVNTEKTYTVVPKPGASDTKVSVQASDGSGPVTLHFRRADALISIDFQGSVPVLRNPHQVSSPPTYSPNNDHNTGGCPNYAGRDSGKYCISRTRVTMSVTPPLYFQTPDQQCSNIGCGYGGWSRTAYLENGEQTVSAEFDNHGASVALTVSAAVWEHVGVQQCGGSQGPVPVNFNQSVSFAVPDDCKSIATVRWLHLPDRSEGMIPFEKEGDDDHVIKRTSTNSAGG